MKKSTSSLFESILERSEGENDLASEQVSTGTNQKKDDGMVIQRLSYQLRRDFRSILVRFLDRFFFHFDLVCFQMMMTCFSSKARIARRRSIASQTLKLFLSRALKYSRLATLLENNEYSISISRSSISFRYLPPIPQNQIKCHRFFIH